MDWTVVTILVVTEAIALIAGLYFRAPTEFMLATGMTTAAYLGLNSNPLTAFLVILIFSAFASFLGTPLAIWNFLPSLLKPQVLGALAIMTALLLKASDPFGYAFQFSLGTGFIVAGIGIYIFGLTHLT